MARLKLITQQQLMLLLRNHRDGAGKKPPVVNIFNPAGAQTWLIHSADPEEPDILHALCDLGFGCAELGSVRLSDLEGIETPIRVGPYSGAVRLERDKVFRPVHSLEIYARAAHIRGRITELTGDLDAAAIGAPGHAGHGRLFA